MKLVKQNVCKSYQMKFIERRFLTIYTTHQTVDIGLWTLGLCFKDISTNIELQVHGVTCY
jgi:hypothetical protein